jgi:hypothetical protein
VLCLNHEIVALAPLRTTCLDVALPTSMLVRSALTVFRKKEYIGDIRFAVPVPRRREVCAELGSSPKSNL